MSKNTKYNTRQVLKCQYYRHRERERETKMYCGDFKRHVGRQATGPQLGNEEEGMFWPEEVMIPTTALLLHSFHIHILNTCVCDLKTVVQCLKAGVRVSVGLIQCAIPHIPLVLYVNVLRAWNNHSRHKPSAHRHAGTQWRTQASAHRAYLCRSVCEHWELICYRPWLNSTHTHLNRSSWTTSQFPIYHLHWPFPRLLKWGKNRKLQVNCKKLL